MKLLYNRGDRGHWIATAVVLATLLIANLVARAAVAQASDDPRYVGPPISEGADNRPAYYVLDAFGFVHAGNGAPAIGQPPYLGFDVMRDLEVLPVAGLAGYVLTSEGIVFRLNPEAPDVGGLPHWVGEDLYLDFEVSRAYCGAEGELLDVDFAVLDILGDVWEATSRPEQKLFGYFIWTTIEGLPYPWNNAHSFANGDETPYFAFDAARAVEVLETPNTYAGCLMSDYSRGR